MSKALVLDTSVAVAWYLPEAFSTEARAWQNKMLKKAVVLLIPRQLHYLEFSNVLRTYVRRGELDRELASDIYALHLEAPLRELDIRLRMFSILHLIFKAQPTTRPISR